MTHPSFFVATPDEVSAHIHRFPLATVITVHGDPLFRVSHIPLCIAATTQPLPASCRGIGELRGHLSRDNPQAKALMEASAPINVLVVFHGHSGYVSPGYYSRKRIDGKVVPTWIYTTVECTGKIVLDNAVLDTVSALTTQEEQKLVEEGLQESCWKVSDAPVEYVDAALKRIVGVRVLVESTTAKWKLSQNRDPEDIRQIAEGVKRRGLCSLSVEVSRVGRVRVVNDASSSSSCQRTAQEFLPRHIAKAEALAIAFASVALTFAWLSMRGRK